jgi:hypothetical protein
MNEIQKERINILEEATRRMKQNDYEYMNFADTEKLISLLKAKGGWEKQIKGQKILNFIKNPQEQKIAEYENEIIKANNDRIKEKHIKPLIYQIKVLELEIMLFQGIFEVCEVAEYIENHKELK